MREEVNIQYTWGLCSSVMRGRVTGARLPSDTASHPRITVALRVSRRRKVQLCTQWMTLMRLCDNGYLELMLHYNFFSVVETDLDVLQQNSGMLNWRRENIRTAKNGVIARCVSCVCLVKVYLVVLAFPYRRRWSEVCVLEKETTGDKYIKRKLQTVTASRHLTGFDVDIWLFFRS
jgi:hypothetical protein